LRVGSIITPGEMLALLFVGAGDEATLPKVGDAPPRFKNWKPPIEGALVPTAMSAWLWTESMTTPQVVQLPPWKLSWELPAPLVSVLDSVVPLTRYTSLLSAVHTVVFVNGFDAQEFTIPSVGIAVFVMLEPSMLTAETPVPPPGGAGRPPLPAFQEPLATYATTVGDVAAPFTRTDKVLAVWPDDATAKVSVCDPEFLLGEAESVTVTVKL
jgi:hypothetical protein